MREDRLRVRWRIEDEFDIAQLGRVPPIKRVSRYLCEDVKHDQTPTLFGSTWVKPVGIAQTRLAARFQHYDSTMLARVARAPKG